MKDCKNIEEIRENIDAIDKKIVKLLSQRRDFVKQAAKFKKNDEDVKAPQRVEEVIKKVKILAIKYKMPPEIVESIYKVMIENFINYEAKQYQESRGVNK
ncbi:MAG TPA: chorismate mutase [Methanobacteriaceae archaeon]|nr:chorismate mutase [Methanobacteriaceae archaeon]